MVIISPEGENDGVVVVLPERFSSLAVWHEKEMSMLNDF
jgi:hypothetical protein